MFSTALKNSIARFRYFKDAGKHHAAIRSLDQAIEEAKKSGLLSLAGTLYSHRSSINNLDSNYGMAISDLIESSNCFLQAKELKASLDAIENSWSLSQASKISGYTVLVRSKVFSLRRTWHKQKIKGLFGELKIKNTSSILKSVSELVWSWFMPLIFYGNSILLLLFYWFVLVTLGAALLFYFGPSAGTFLHRTYTAIYMSITMFFGFGFFEQNIQPAKSIGIISLAESLVGVPFTALLVASFIGKIIDE